ncbi:hypothetical protein JTB14_025842 [Gonioctena quinquepunctata]|nr:hypothetical protein JTB14_025842 [Gonioctena quinquepunctata]
MTPIAVVVGETGVLLPMCVYGVSTLQSCQVLHVFHVFHQTPICCLQKALKEINRFLVPDVESLTDRKKLCIRTSDFLAKTRGHFFVKCVMHHISTVTT